MNFGALARPEHGFEVSPFEPNQRALARRKALPAHIQDNLGGQLAIVLFHP